MQLTEEGRFEAKVVDYGLAETNDGTPQVVVMFNTVEEKPRTITWYGILNAGKAQEIALKALLTMGLKGNDVAALEAGKDTGLIDTEKSVSITVENHVYNGKTQTRVSWVNPLRSFRADPQTTAKVASLNLKGVIQKLRQDTGIKDTGPDFNSYNGTGPVTKNTNGFTPGF